MWKPSWQFVAQFRRRRREAMRGDPEAGPRPAPVLAAGPAAPPALVDERPRLVLRVSVCRPAPPAGIPTAPRRQAPPWPASGAWRYAPAGQPINRRSPFYIGLVGGFGVLAAYTIWQAVASLDTVFTLLLVAFFLTLALDPLVEALVQRGVGRALSVLLCCCSCWASSRCWGSSSCRRWRTGR